MVLILSVPILLLISSVSILLLLLALKWCMLTFVAFVIFLPALHLISVEESALYVTSAEFKVSIVIFKVKLVFMIEDKLFFSAAVQIT